MIREFKWQILNRKSFVWFVQDEATSALSTDVEEVIYRRCIETGMTLIRLSKSIDHRVMKPFSISIYGTL